jgi:hypothetical protein
VTTNGQEQFQQIGPDREQVTSFERIIDEEWERSHFTFKQRDGCVFRVPKEEIIHVQHCDDEDGIPPQPAHYWGIALSDTLWWVRSGDGWWYKCGARPSKKSRMLWADLWKTHGRSDYQLLVPVPPSQTPVMIDKLGPVEHVTFPDMSSGEPKPGLVLQVTKDRGLCIYDTRTKADIELDFHEVAGLVGLHYRTMKKRDEENDDPGDSG